MHRYSPNYYLKYPLAVLSLFIFLCSIATHTIAGKLILNSASEPDYPPLSFRNKQGDADGFAVTEGDNTTLALHNEYLVKTDYTLVKQVAVSLLFILFVILFWNRKLHKEIQTRVAIENELKLSEERFRALFDRMHSGVAVYEAIDNGEDFIFKDFNRAAEEIEQIKKQDIIGKRVKSVFPGVENLGLFPLLKKVWQTGQAEFLSDTVYTDGRDSGSWRNNWIYKLPSGDIVVVYDDISERKLADTALRRAQKMDAIGQLTGGIAHDFNNILSIIIGNIDFLQLLFKDNKKADKRLKTIHKAAQRAARLTRQLLGFSRPQPAQQKITDINNIIIGMDSLIIRSVTPEVEVKQELVKNLWLSEIDPGDFEDALLNLIINARDAMQGSGQLILETCNSTLDSNYCAQNPGAIPGDYVQLSVSDNGEGIPVEQQDKIFEPFFTTKAQGKGTGLGLAIVFGFAKRSGGYTKVYSESGVGTTMRIYLPRSHKTKSPEVITIPQTQELPRGKETILIVDDEADLLELACTSLQTLGYKVLSAANVQQALQQLHKNPSIELLFSDVVMPGGKNGYELAEIAFVKYPKLKILLTSGYSSKVMAHNGQARFNTNLLSKPYTQAELAIRVRSLLADNNLEKSASTDTSKGVEQSKISISSDWKDSYKLNIPSMDKDHRIQLDLFNLCRHAMESGESNEQVSRILATLQEQIQLHFKREEVVMKICGYPGFKNHTQVHRILFKQLDKILRQVRKGQMNIGDFMIFFNNWWIDHIQNMDQAYAIDCKGKEELIMQALGDFEAGRHS